MNTLLAYIYWSNFLMFLGAWVLINAQRDSSMLKTWTDVGRAKKNLKYTIVNFIAIAIFYFKFQRIL